MERKTLVVTQRSALWVVVGWPTEAATFMNGATEELLKMRCNPRFCWLARPDSPNSVLLVLLWERVPFVGPLWVVLGPLDGLNISVACCDWKFNWYPQQRHIAVFFLLLDDDEESAISCLLGDDYTFWHFLGVHKFHETCVWIINLLLLFFSEHVCVMELDFRFFLYLATIFLLFFKKNYIRFT